VRRDRASALLILALAAVVAGSAVAAELGTLFTSAQERARLDRLRRGEPPVQAATSAGGGGKREVTGFVQRSDGQGTVWIDGVPLQVTSPRAAPLFDPKGVRAYSERKEGDLKVERKPPG
jgi:hypothetical protein